MSDQLGLLFKNPLRVAEELRDAWVLHLYRGADEGLWDAVVDIEAAFGLSKTTRPSYADVQP